MVNLKKHLNGTFIRKNFLNHNLKKISIQETSETNLLQEQLRLQAAINSVTVGFVITDTSGEIVTINRAAKKILILGEHSANIKTAFTEPYLANLDCSVDDLDQKLSGLLKLKHEIQICLKNKQAVVFESLDYKNLVIRISISPIVDLKDKTRLDLDVIGTVILVEDITEDRILERSKAEMFSIATHELKTPLAVIKGNMEIIKKYFPHLMEDTKLSMIISDVYENCLRLINIVNDFLDATRLEQGKINFKKQVFDLLVVISEVINDLAPEANNKGIYLKLENDHKDFPMVQADRELARQVLVNLLDNSLKFTQKGGISINIEKQGDFLKIFVKDTGEGISAKNQLRMFRKFQLATENLYTRTTNKNTGLGLYISKMMVEGMGGKIVLENSGVNVGSVFSFTLPIAGN